MRQQFIKLSLETGLYWRKEKASLNTQIFCKWITEFIPVARAQVIEYEWVLRFYDDVSVHTTSTGIERIHSTNMCVIVLPADTSGPTKPFDVSFFATLKQIKTL